MSSEASAIAEIEERLRDLVDALREAGAKDLANDLWRYTRDFTSPQRVRKSVNDLRQQLEDWRANPSDFVDTPKVTFAANRLEDLCRDGLASGVIVAAPLTVAAHARRKATIALATLLISGFVLAVPVALIAAGIDITDLGAERKSDMVRLPRGEEASANVSVLVEAELPLSVIGLELEPLGGCKAPLPRDATCGEATPRLWPEGRLKTYEIKLRHQAYGLLFSIADAEVLDGKFGKARVLLAATDETPEGRYEVPLTGAYLGYTPQRCEIAQRLTASCPDPRIGKGERHAGLPVPIIVVEVTPGDPARRVGEKRLAEAEAEEARRKAEERAGQIAEAMTEIRAVVAETEKLLGRKRWQEARPRIQKLQALFAPLDGLVLTQEDLDLIPVEVGEIRTRFEAMQDRLLAFENRIFEQTFLAVIDEKNRHVAEERILQRIASQFAVTPEYVEEVYTGRAEEIQKRMAARDQAHLDQVKAHQQALEQRCGTLPKDGWRSVNEYLGKLPLASNVELVLGECLTPRLTEDDCWILRCTYKLKVEVSVERPKVITKREANFFLVHGRITRHRDG